MSEIKRIIEIDKDLYESIAGKNSDTVEPRQVVRSFQATIADAIAHSKPYDDSGDCISREALKKVLCEEYEAREHYIGEMMLKAIDNAQTVEAYPFEQVQELVKLNQQFAQEIENLKIPQGEWEHDELFGECAYVCSFCHTIWTSSEIQNMHYCPNCGADMRGGAE